VLSLEFTSLPSSSSSSSLSLSFSLSLSLSLSCVCVCVCVCVYVCMCVRFGSTTGSVIGVRPHVSKRSYGGRTTNMTYDAVFELCSEVGIVRTLLSPACISGG
jgi:hypothetical protein